MGPSQNAAPKRQARNRSNLAVAACDRCRRSKLRCDGIRPSCSRCLSAGTASCHYGTNVSETRIQARQRRYQEMESLRGLLNDSLVWLASQSSETVTDCLQQVSTAEDPISALCSTVTTQRAVQLPLRVSPSRTVATATPLLSTFAELDVSLQSSSSYPWISPLDCLFTNHLNSEDFSSYSSLSYDERTVAGVLSLDDLKIEFWTTVPISNQLAADLLRTYWRVEHPIYAFFDWNLFCQDLLSRRTRFCSPLLLNSIMFWCCNTFSPLFPEAISYTDAFANSTQLLLGAEQNVQSELNVASFMLLAMSNICLGENDLAKQYMIAGVYMAESLHLMGQDRYELQQFGEMHPQAADMLKHVAWGAFNVQVVYTLHFRDLYSGTFTKRPPLIPKPAVAPFIDLTQTTQTSITQLLPQPISFPSFCEFWCLAHEIAAVYYAAPGPIHESVPLAFAQTMCQRLMQWMDTLPAELARGERMAHNVVEMHICYHATLMDLFRPFVSERQLNPDPMHRCQAIFSLSMSHLRALTASYHMCFRTSAESRTISWIHGPLYVATAIIYHEREESQRMSFLACMEAFKSLLESHAVVEVFVKGLYGMAVGNGVLSVGQAQRHMRTICATRDKALLARSSKSSAIVDQELALKDRTNATGDDLAVKYDEVVMFDDYVDLDQSE